MPLDTTVQINWTIVAVVLSAASLALAIWLATRATRQQNASQHRENITLMEEFKHDMREALSDISDLKRDKLDKSIHLLTVERIDKEVSQVRHGLRGLEQRAWTFTDKSAG